MQMPSLPGKLLVGVLAGSLVHVAGTHSAWSHPEEHSFGPRWGCRTFLWAPRTPQLDLFQFSLTWVCFHLSLFLLLVGKCPKEGIWAVQLLASGPGMGTDTGYSPFPVCPVNGLSFVVLAFLPWALLPFPVPAVTLRSRNFSDFPHPKQGSPNSFDLGTLLTSVRPLTSMECCWQHGFTGGALLLALQAPSTAEQLEVL